VNKAQNAASFEPYSRQTSHESRSSSVNIGDRHKILTTPVGLSFHSEVTFEAWVRAGTHISRIMSSSAWYLGDWVVFGQDKYENRYRRAVDAAGLDYQTLRNYAWVARSFTPTRRRPGLSFQHHAEVASLPAQEQDEWLDKAERHGWSRNQLRKNLRESRNRVVKIARSPMPTVYVPEEIVERWRLAAAESDADFESWVVKTLDNAADRALHAISATG
jgi:hypothetical protein